MAFAPPTSMMRKVVSAALMSVCVAVGAGCAVQTGPEPDETPTSQAGLSFSASSHERVAGSFVRAGSVIRFSSELNGSVLRVVIDVNGAELRASLDMSSQTANLDGQGNALYAPDLQALDAFRAALEKLDDREAEKVEDSPFGYLVKMASYFSRAPQSFTIPTRSFRRTVLLAVDEEHERSTGEGITYLWQCKNSAPNSGKYATAHWTQANGTWMSWYAACGNISSACQGRCGPGCPSWFNFYYTKDCFDHDKCLDYNPGDTTWSPTATNCGGEWTDAFDDYTFGSSSGW